MTVCCYLGTLIKSMSAAVNRTTNILILSQSITCQSNHTKVGPSVGAGLWDYHHWPHHHAPTFVSNSLPTFNVTSLLTKPQAWSAPLSVSRPKSGAMLENVKMFSSMTEASPINPTNLTAFCTTWIAGPSYANRNTPPHHWMPSTHVCMLCMTRSWMANNSARISTSPT